MRRLQGDEEKQARHFLEMAAMEARKSPCFRSGCGAVIVNKGSLVATGYNRPPLNKGIDECIKENLPDNFKSDPHCCLHAEQLAIKDALLNQPDLLSGSTLYFIRVNKKGEMKKAGNPYCTICSKESLDAEIKEFVLWHDHGICAYDTDEYNDLSFEYRD